MPQIVHPAQKGIQLRIFHDTAQMAHRPRELLGYIHAAYMDRPGGRLNQADQHPDRRRFPSPVRPQKPKHLSSVQLEG
ncbi:hypothetical protein D3C79_950310 [compost metagenome]